MDRMLTMYLRDFPVGFCVDFVSFCLLVRIICTGSVTLSVYFVVKVCVFFIITWM